MPRDHQPAERVAERDGVWVETHPSYGMITVHHTSGMTGPMFGSVLARHEGYVTLRLTHGRRVHSHGEDHFHSDRGSIVEFTMTHAQFVHMISNPNLGSGTPCTLSRVGGEAIPSLPDDHADRIEVNEVLNGVTDSGREIGRKLGELRSGIEATLADAKVSRKTINLVLAQVASVEREVSDSLPFLVHQVRSATDRVVAAGKAELDSLMSTVATRLGFRSLKRIAEQADAEDRARATAIEGGD